MSNLFSDLSSENKIKVKKGPISGLTLIENFITDIEHDEILFKTSKSEWQTTLKRRVQHFGYTYDYRAKKINENMRIEPLPIWAEKLALRLVQQNYFDVMPDQMIVNEYLPGQGISKHIDCEPCFDDTIVSISLGSDAIMNFYHKLNNERKEVLLPVKSAIIMKGEARYHWYHEIASRKTDKIGKVIFKRKRRISLTYRKVILSE